MACCAALIINVALFLIFSSTSSSRKQTHYQDQGRDTQRYNHQDLSCALAPVSPADRREDKSILRVATFNAEWLFDGIDDDMNMIPWADSFEAKNHLRAVAEVLGRIDADIVNLVEVEDCAILRELVKLLPHHGYVPYLHPGTDTSTGQNVALLTRIDPLRDLQRSSKREFYPSADSRCRYTGPKGETGVSKHYHTVLQVNGRPLHLVGLHFRAVPNKPSSCAQREAQSEVIKNLILEIFERETDNLAGGLIHQPQVILLGDFNDLDNQIPDTNRDEPARSDVLEKLRILSPSSTTDDLFNVAEMLPVSDRYTYEGKLHSGQKLRSLIDHILVSSDLYRTVTAVNVHHNYGDSTREMIQTSGHISDHFPLSVTFNMSLWE